MGKDNKIFCTAPFTTLRIESYTPNLPGKYKNFGLVFKPGCVYDPDGPIPDLDAFLNGQEMTEHRDNLLNGTVPRRACERCWRSEQIGLDSTRLQLLKKPWASDEQKIKLLDVFFSNICNMSCLMCNPSCSSKLAQERFSIGELEKSTPLVDNTNIILDTIDQLPDLEQISFIGGEFFIFKNNLVILDKMIKQGIGARVVTNASVITDALLDRLKQIKDLEIQISIDGIEDVYEFLRYPNDWNTLVENFYIIKKTLPHAKINFHVVVQPLNIQNLHETMTWANKKNMPVSLHNLATPLRLSWIILNAEEKQKLVSILHNKNQDQKFKLTTKQKSIIENYMDSISKEKFDSDKRQSFTSFLSKTMKHRGISENKIRAQFGIFTELSDLVISSM